MLFPCLSCGTIIPISNSFGSYCAVCDTCKMLYFVNPRMRGTLTFSDYSPPIGTVPDRRLNMEYIRSEIISRTPEDIIRRILVQKTGSSARMFSFVSSIEGPYQVVCNSPWYWHIDPFSLDPPSFATVGNKGKFFMEIRPCVICALGSGEFTGRILHDPCVFIIKDAGSICIACNCGSLYFANPRKLGDLLIGGRRFTFGGDEDGQIETLFQDDISWEELREILTLKTGSPLRLFAQVQFPNGELSLVCKAPWEWHLT